MLFRTPRVGQEISAYCGKCKIERTHIIAAMDGEAVRKVTCTMCRSNHNYKLKSNAGTTGRTSQKRVGSRAAATKAASAFTIDPKRPVKSYSMEASFSAGDVINHPTFGLGAVESALAPNKIEVRFQEGKKILLHNMKQARL